MQSIVNRKPSFFMSILNFFRTAPRTKSKKVVDLEKAGKTALLIEAIEAERKEGRQGKGQSKDGKVTVKRVGSHA